MTLLFFQVIIRYYNKIVTMINSKQYTGKVSTQIDFVVVPNGMHSKCLKRFINSLPLEILFYF